MSSGAIIGAVVLIIVAVVVVIVLVTRKSSSGGREALPLVEGSETSTVWVYTKDDPPSDSVGETDIHDDTYDTDKLEKTMINGAFADQQVSYCRPLRTKQTTIVQATACSKYTERDTEGGEAMCKADSSCTYIATDASMLNAQLYRINGGEGEEFPFTEKYRCPDDDPANGKYWGLNVHSQGKKWRCVTNMYLTSDEDNTVGNYTALKFKPTHFSLEGIEPPKDAIYCGKKKCDRDRDKVNCSVFGRSLQPCPQNYNGRAYTEQSLWYDEPFCATRLCVPWF